MYNCVKIVEKTNSKTFAFIFIFRLELKCRNNGFFINFFFNALKASSASSVQTNFPVNFPLLEPFNSAVRPATTIWPRRHPEGFPPKARRDSLPDPDKYANSEMFYFSHHFKCVLYINFILYASSFICFCMT